MANEKVKELKEKITVLNDYIIELQGQLKNEREKNDTVTKEEYNGLLEQLTLEKYKNRELKRLLKVKSTQNEFDTQEFNRMKNNLARRQAGRKRIATTEDAEIIKLRDQELTVKAISEKTGVSIATINRILKKHKLKSNSN